MKELFRVYFHDSRLADDSCDGQGQQNLDVRRCIIIRGDWNLTNHAINQSNMIRELGSFKPFKSAGTDEIVPALLQQRVLSTTSMLHI
jgi:hypothetical protein